MSAEEAAGGPSPAAYQASPAARAAYFAKAKKKAVKPAAKKEAEVRPSGPQVDEYGYLEEEETEEQKAARGKVQQETQRLRKIKNHIYAIWKNIYEGNESSYAKALDAIKTYINSRDAEKYDLYTRWVDKSFPKPDNVTINFEQSESHYVIKAYRGSDEITHLTLPKKLSQNEGNRLGIHFTTNPGDRKEFLSLGDFKMLGYRGGRTRRAKGRISTRRKSRL